MTVKFEYFIDSTLAGFGNHECCVLFEDAVVTLLISLTEIAPSYRLPDSKMVEFPSVCFHSHNQISEALSIGQLTEHHRKQLIPAGIAFDILVAIVFLHNVFEFLVIKEFN